MAARGWLQKGVNPIANFALQDNCEGVNFLYYSSVYIILSLKVMHN